MVREVGRARGRTALVRSHRQGREPPAADQERSQALIQMERWRLRLAGGGEPGHENGREMEVLARRAA